MQFEHNWAFWQSGQVCKRRHQLCALPQSLHVRGMVSRPKLGNTKLYFGEMIKSHSHPELKVNSAPNEMTNNEGGAVQIR